MKINYPFSLLLSFLVLLTSLVSIGHETKSDSLWSEFREAKSDSVRAFALANVAKETITSNPDSAIVLFGKADSIVESISPVSADFTLKYATLLRGAGLHFREISEYSKSIEMYRKALDIYSSIDNVLGISQCNLNLGNAFFSMGSFDSALKYYYKALEHFNSSNNNIGIADCYNNIGSVLKEMESYDKAMEYHTLSRDIYEELLAKPEGNSVEAIKGGLAYSYNNIGIIHWYKDSYEQALKNYKKSLELKQALNDLNGVAQAYNNIAILYASQDRFENGIEYFQKGLDVYLNTGNRIGQASVHGNLASLSLIMSKSAVSDSEAKQYMNKALTNAQQAFEIAKSISSAAYIGESAGYLKEIYEELGNTSKALEFADELLVVRSEIFSNEKANALAQMTTRYEVEKNQLQLESMKKEKIYYKKTIVTQKVVIFMSVGIIVMLIVFLIVLLMYFKQKRRANQVLAERNNEVLQQKEEISAQLDELEDKQGKLKASKKEIENLYHIAIEQKETLEKQKVKIDDSIRYAYFIQSAILPDLDVAFVNQSWGTQSYFVMFRPKDVVSGDFYWATRINDWLIVSVVDCTGHGVPGALMSMLGISYLNEIVQSSDVTKPSKILSKLRSYIIGALKQKDEWESQRDGMDMSIVSLNIKTKQCFWAGANSPLWIVRADQLKGKPHAIPEVEVIKPNPFPVAVHVFMGEFTNHEVMLNSGDKLYMFSDGFPDQFGGPKGKKYNMYKAFKKLIAQTSILPMKEQGRALEETFDNWIDCDGVNYEQIDDVTVLGIMV
ncbi:MAG: tetratricopeptide repeat protein [Bacteroidales bacterium]|nr:tetratricopeptide repeat protein [Bacteroidales bacterium]